MYIAEDFESLVEELDDGFERLGSEGTPFTLRSGGEPLERAEEVHERRDPDDRREDERSNEPVTRDVPQWEANLWEFDFPFVDTIPSDELLGRAETAADEGRRLGFISAVDVDAEIADARVKGRFKPASKIIYVDADEEGFLGYRSGPTLAHEVGHAFHVGVSRLNDTGGFEERDEDVFRTEEQRRDAIAISERLRGPIPETSPDVRSYRLSAEELFADVFASLVIEPEAAHRVGPEAVGRVEGMVGELLPDTT